MKYHYSSVFISLCFHMETKENPCSFNIKNTAGINRQLVSFSPWRLLKGVALNYLRNKNLIAVSCHALLEKKNHPGKWCSLRYKGGVGKFFGSERVSFPILTRCFARDLLVLFIKCMNMFFFSYYRIRAFSTYFFLCLPSEIFNLKNTSVFISVML